MKFNIDDQYRIKSDKHGWMIQKRNGQCVVEKTGEPQYLSIRHYGTLAATLDGLAQLLIRTSEAQTLSEALKEVEAITHKLTSALNTEYRVIPYGQLNNDTL
jgi:hypothetical protein